jgi:RNA polymerase sigma-70 factor (ECF subfamily)
MFLELEEHPEKELSDESVYLASRDTPELFRMLIKRYEAPFLRKARKVLFREEEAIDAVQDAFTKLYIKGRQFTPQGEGSFRSFAYTVLLNTLFTRYKKIKNRQEFPLLEEFEEFIPDLRGMEHKEQKETADYVVSVLKRLPPQTAAILKKFFLEEKSGAEIAAEEGISIGAVKTRVHRAKEAFRDATFPVQ